MSRQTALSTVLSESEVNKEVDVEPLDKKTANQFLLDCLQPLIDTGLTGVFETSAGDPHHGAPIDVAYATNYHLVIPAADTNAKAVSGFRRSIRLVKNGKYIESCYAALLEGSVTIRIQPDTSNGHWWQRPVPFTIHLPDGAELGAAVKNELTSEGVHLFTPTQGRNFDFPGCLFPGDCLETRIFDALTSKEHHEAKLQAAQEKLSQLEKDWPK